MNSDSFCSKCFSTRSSRNFNSQELTSRNFPRSKGSSSTLWSVFPPQDHSQRELQDLKNVGWITMPRKTLVWTNQRRWVLQTPQWKFLILQRVWPLWVNNEPTAVYSSAAQPGTWYFTDPPGSWGMTAASLYTLDCFVASSTEDLLRFIQFFFCKPLHE